MKQLINFYQSNMEECFFVLLYKLAAHSFITVHDIHEAL